MIESLAILGLAKITETVFTPILKDIAKETAVNVSASYIGKAFEKVFSVVNKGALTKATGRSLKELLDLIENELLDADYSDDELRSMIPHIKLFIEHPDVIGCFEPLYLDPDYKLDPKIFAESWNSVDIPELPSSFSWQRIAKRFNREVGKIRNDSADELKETFDTLQANRNSNALVELAGLPPEFDLDNYQEALLERFGNLSLDSINADGAAYDKVRLWSVFVPQSARECHLYQPQLLELPKEHQKFLIAKGEIDSGELEELEKFQQEQRKAYFDEPLGSILDSCNDPNLNSMVVLGDPGSGKSTLLRYLALEWARNENANERYKQTLPILIELRDYNLWECNNGKSFTSYLHYASNWHRLNQQTLDHLLKQPDRVVLLLDGLDEVFDPAQREQVINDIHRFSNDYSGTRIIVTSRVVGYKAKRLRDAGFSDFMLQDLDSRQIDEFLHRWHEITFEDKKEAQKKRDRLSKAIHASPSISMLAGNPLLLTMMAILNRYQELPRDRVLLYQKSAEVLLQQWDTERGLADFPEISKEIDLRTKTAILRKVAYRMQNGKVKGEAANIIKGQDLTDLIEEYLQEELNFQQSRNAANALVRQLRERNFILCFLGADSYAFVHRTFLEYFCAAEIAHQFKEEQSLLLPGLKQVYHKHYRDDDWAEVLRLVCGQVDEQFVGDIVEQLVGETDLDSWDGNSYLPEIPLAVWCFGEARKISKLSNVGEMLFTHIKTLFNTRVNILEPKFYEALITATKGLNNNWPGAKKSPPKEELKSRMHHSHIFWPEFNSALFQDKKQILEFSLSSSWAVRSGAISSLATNWQDESTRALLIKLAKDDENIIPRREAIQALAKNWKDESTRALLIERARDDEDEYPRRKALGALIEHWRDESTRALLIERATDDENSSPRVAALKALAEHWRDDLTRSLLIERATDDEHASPRVAALRALAKHWGNDLTRSLLIERATDDEHESPRAAALLALAEHWRDDLTRSLLIERATDDEHESPRCNALEALSKYWHDESICELLIERAKDDVHADPREAALEALEEHWLDVITVYKFIFERARIDGIATRIIGQKHSEFGGIIFTEDFDGVAPYLNPKVGLTSEHIKEAAEIAKVTNIPEALKSLSEHLGWDISQGSS